MRSSSLLALISLSAALCCGVGCSSGDSDASTSGAGGSVEAASSAGPASSTGSGDSGGTGGVGGAGRDAGTGGEAGAPPGYVPSIVVVGFSGLRIVSRDLGLTWDHRVVEPGSEEHGIQGVAYGFGMYVAVGIKIFVSPDGMSWSERPNPWDSQWIGGLAFGNGVFVGAGGCAITLRSLDGLDWVQGPLTVPGNCVEGGSVRSVAFGGGQFALGSDSGTVYASADGTSFAPLAGVETSQVAYCDGAFNDRAACSGLVESGAVGSPQYYESPDGIYIRLDGYTIERSTDAKTWDEVYTDPSSFYYGLAFGYSPP